MCDVSEADRRARRSPRDPSSSCREAANRSAGGVAPGNRTLGVMLPYTPLHHLLFAGRPYDALVMTSGNLSEEPIVVQRRGFARSNRRRRRLVPLHNRDIYMRADDSVVRTFEGRERVLRRSRGFVPQTIDLGPVARGPRRRRRTEERLLPHQRPARHPQPAHRRPGKLRDPGLLRGDPRQPEEALFRVAPRAVGHDLHPGY
jgi:hydrogenase maturation protein HypF